MLGCDESFIGLISNKPFSFLHNNKTIGVWYRCAAPLSATLPKMYKPTKDIIDDPKLKKFFIVYVSQTNILDYCNNLVFWTAM